MWEAAIATAAGAAAYSARHGTSRLIGATWKGKRIVAAEYSIEGPCIHLKYDDGTYEKVPEEDILLNTSALYGYRSLKTDRYYEMMRNSYAPTVPKVFPRTDKQRVERMNRYVEWKREKIKEKWVRRAMIGVGGYFGLALLIVLASYVNRLMFHAVLS